MANEFDCQITMTVRGNNLAETYSERYLDSCDDVTTLKGPTPDYKTVSELGTEVDLSQLTTPGNCLIKNIEPVGSTLYFHWGVWDPETNKYYPVGELAAGQSAKFKFSRLFGNEFNTGTGTAAGTGATNTLKLYAVGGSCRATVKVFER